MLHINLHLQYCWNKKQYHKGQNKQMCQRLRRYHLSKGQHYFFVCNANLNMLGNEVLMLAEHLEENRI